jgi:Ca2+-binding EF-hand superfamily protein
MLLQRLLQSQDSTSPAAQQEMQGARQSMPGGPPPPPNVSMQGGGAASLSGATMSVAVSLQISNPASAGTSSTKAAATPSVGQDIAKDLISSLDTDGDGQVSADEINAAFKAAGITTDASKTSDAVKKLDADGNGSLSAAELGTAIDAKIQAQGVRAGGHHGGHHHDHDGGGSPPSASAVASSLVSSLDQNSDKGLSLSEMLKGLGQTTDATSAQTTAFGSLDSNGDGSLSSDELTSAITNMMQKDMQAYAKTAYSQSASITA